MILPVFINDDEHYFYKEMEKSLISYPSKMLKQRTLTTYQTEKLLPEVKMATNLNRFHFSSSFPFDHHIHFFYDSLYHTVVH